MASSSKQIALLFLLTLLSSLQIHARDSQFFNKVSSKTTTNVVKETEEPLSNKEQEPTFMPENESGYGLYGHESGQLPPSATTPSTTTPSTTTPSTTPTTFTGSFQPYKADTKRTLPNPKWLPKNYNPVAYVTQPENEQPEDNPEFSATTTTTHSTTVPTDNNYNYEDGANNYYDSKDQGLGGAKFMDSSYTTTTNRENYNSNGNTYYNPQNEALDEPSYMQKRYNNKNSYHSSYNGGNNFNNVEQQGMSDTRFLENGKYFYDVSSEKYVSNPFENSARTVSSREYSRNVNNNNWGYPNSRGGAGGYQNMENFQDLPEEDDLP